MTFPTRIRIQRALALYVVGLASGVALVALGGSLLAQPLFVVGAWLANASHGPQWEISVEPTLRLATATTDPKPFAKKGR